MVSSAALCNWRCQSTLLKRGYADLQQWLAAQQFAVEETWEGQLEAYQVGDALTRVRRFVAHGVPAMAIPASPEIALPGAQVYTAPALLEDKIIKGVLVGHREERTVVTLQAGGDYSIPARICLV